MVAVLYTTTDNIRAAISVSEQEVTDAQITNLLVAEQLTDYLDEKYPDHAAVAAGGSAIPPIDADVVPYRRLRLLSMYAAAVIVLQAGQNLLAQTMIDGGTTMSRFAKDDITTLLENMEAMRDRWLGILQGTDTVSSMFIPPFITAQPDYDPVTGC